MIEIKHGHFQGNSNIGIFMTAWNNHIIIPPTTTQTLQKTIQETLKAQPKLLTIAESNLIGLFTVLNDNGILVPHTITSLEFEALKNAFPELHVDYLESKITALGNTIVTTNKTAIISPEFTKQEQAKIADVLDVEVIPHLLVNTHLVGSVTFTTEHGTLIHPLATDDDINFLKETFRTNVDITTINRGIPYPKSGILANNNGAVVGSDTTGPETMRIFEVLYS